MVGLVEIVFGTEYFAYGVKRLGIKLPFSVGRDVLVGRRTRKVNSP